MHSLPAWAEALSCNLLEEPLPRRWSHVQGVAARARSLEPAFDADKELLEAAAWLHDVGYLPELARTGLHGLDGARYLRDVQHADPMLCRLVAFTPAPSSRPKSEDSPTSSAASSTPRPSRSPTPSPAAT